MLLVYLQFSEENKMLNQKTIRQLILNVGLSAALLLIPIFVYSQGACGIDDNPIQAENCLMGDEDWMINPAAGAYNHQVEGYASATSVNAGQIIRFHINSGTENQTVSIDIYRLGWYGGAGARKWTEEPIVVPDVDNKPYPVPNSQTGRAECNWESESAAFWSVPEYATSGFYIAKLTGAGGLQSYIPFVVRNDSYESRVLFKIGVTTHQAYNIYPGILYSPLSDYRNGKSLYSAQSGGPPLPGFTNGSRQAREISFNRPYAIISTFAIYDTLGTGFINYEYPMIRWLESAGYDVTYITDIDLHNDSASTTNIFQPGKHKVMLSVGHDEYWSWEMRDKVEIARDHATLPLNIAFFSGNSVYWQIRLTNSSGSGTFPADASSRTLTAYKEYARNDNFPAANDPYYTDDIYANDKYITDLWRNNIIKPPEDELVGIMTIPPGGDSTHGPVFPGNYDPIFAPGANALVLAETAPLWLKSEISGTQSLDNLIGYESDELYPANVYSTHNSTIIVGESAFYGWRGFRLVYLGDAETTFYTMVANGAKVFAASGQQWSWGLDDWGATGAGIGPDFPERLQSMKSDAQQITRNILNCFSTYNSCGN